MKSNQRTAVLLINVGTPDSPKVKDVRRYLRQFLNDKRVMDIHWLARKMLVNLIIVPFRAPKSARLYRQLWTREGSPLIFHTTELVRKLNKKAPLAYRYFFAMRYQNPSIHKVLGSIRKESFDRIIILPLFPQYASSTTATALQTVYREILTWQVVPEIRSVNQFYDHPDFIDVFANRIKSFQLEKYDHIVFSYHGLPVRHVQKIHPDIPCNTCHCDKVMPGSGRFCYRATCYETSRLLASGLGLGERDYSVSFQSRLSNNWLKPFTDEVIIDLAKSGKKKVLITSPSFVTDCLETIIELGYEYNLLFKAYGGEEIILVPSLNATDDWVDVILKLSSF